MTKVQKQMMKVAKTTGNKMLAVKLALLANVGNNRTVHIDEAYDDIKDFVTPKEFSGYLAALTKEGFYEAEQDPFYKGKCGYVNVQKAE